MISSAVTVNPMNPQLQRVDSLQKDLEGSIGSIQEDYKFDRNTAAAMFITSRIVTFDDLYNSEGNVADPKDLTILLTIKTFPPIPITARECFQYLFSGEVRPTEPNQARLWGLLKFFVESELVCKEHFIAQIQAKRPLCICPNNQEAWVDNFLHHLKTSDVSHLQELIDLGIGTISKIETLPLLQKTLSTPSSLLDRVSIWIFSDYDCDCDTALKVIAFVPAILFLAVAYPVNVMIDCCITLTE